MMGPVPLGGTGAGIARSAKIVTRFMKTGGRPVFGITGVETVRGGGNVEGSPMAECPGGRVRILDDEYEALGSVRYPGPCQRR